MYHIVFCAIYIVAAFMMASKPIFGGEIYNWQLSYEIISLILVVIALHAVATIIHVNFVKLFNGLTKIAEGEHKNGKGSIKD